MRCPASNSSLQVMRMIAIQNEWAPIIRSPSLSWTMAQAISELTVSDHRRDAAGLVYVYPVLSRRAGGVSVGVNLNPNNACNWRCIYCQVPDLKRGPAPRINVPQLESELRGLLTEFLAADTAIKDI